MMGWDEDVLKVVKMDWMMVVSYKELEYLI